MIQIRALRQKALPRAQRAAVTSAPERVRDLIRARHRIAGKQILEPVHQPERGRLPQRGARASLHQASCSAPLPERHRIRERRAAPDYSAGSLDIRAVIEQRIERLDIVAAGRPVKRRLGMAPFECCVHVGAVRYQNRHNGPYVRKVAGPVRRHVEQGSTSAFGRSCPG